MDPCGHDGLHFGKIQAERLILRDIVACPECWCPGMHVGTKVIKVHVLYGIFETVDVAGVTNSGLEKKRVEHGLAIAKELM